MAEKASAARTSSTPLAAPAPRRAAPLPAPP